MPAELTPRLIVISDSLLASNVEVFQSIIVYWFLAFNLLIEGINSLRLSGFSLGPLYFKIKCIRF